MLLSPCRSAPLVFKQRSATCALRPYQADAMKGLQRQRATIRSDAVGPFEKAGHGPGFETVWYPQPADKGQVFDIVTETLRMSVPVGLIVTDWRPPRAAMPMLAVKPTPAT